MNAESHDWSVVFAAKMFDEERNNQRQGEADIAG